MANRSYWKRGRRRNWLARAESYLTRYFGPLTPTVRYLLIANLAMFLLNLFMLRPDPYSPDYMTIYLSLIPATVFPELQFWRLGTYMFLHGGAFHLAFNMIVLWVMGSPLERVWGQKKFLIYYFMCGIGAGVVCVPFYYMTGDAMVRIIGASGAIFGLLTAYALIYPNSVILVFGIWPMRAKWLVIILMVFELYTTASITGGKDLNVASIAHLSGAVIGYFYIRRFMDIKAYYLRFKNKRKKRPFRVIDGDDDKGPWLH